jgi:hypothetical protein
MISLALAMASAVVDVLLTVQDDPLRTITKPLTIFLIANYYLRHGSSPPNICALMLCGFGDVLLLDTGRNLNAGALFFALGHLHYGWQFLQLVKEFRTKLLLPLVPMAMVSAALILTASKPELQVLSLCYNVFIGTMIGLAFQTGILWLQVGAFLFFVSDSMILVALDKGTWLDVPIMATYWGAQLTIQAGMVQAALAPSRVK